MSDRQRSEIENRFHGGDLADAIGYNVCSRNDLEDEDWLDLSTGISPHAYPLTTMPDTAWERLPGRSELETLIAAAADCYGAPDAAHVVAGPGSQALIQMLPNCLPNKPVALVGPTYNGHHHGWQTSGRDVRVRFALDECNPKNITVLVNPNNPDGRILPPAEIFGFADLCTRAGGWLIVDEAYCDLEPAQSVASSCDAFNMVVLRSFGKFFGLAGLRLGFAIAPLQLTNILRNMLGSWAVSGPAIFLGTQALNDTAWHDAQRDELRTAALQLDKAFKTAGISVKGGTALFRLAQSPHAPRLFEHLLAHRIYVRRFDDHPEWLRFGLPWHEGDWNKLEHALSTFKT